jgi:hypothetical protein
MTISAVADDAFERGVERGVDRAERARVRNRILQMTDHERYEADWPAVRRDPRDKATPRIGWRLNRR